MTLYRGFRIQEEFAGVKSELVDAWVSVMSLAADGVTVNGTIGIYDSVEEAKAAINGALDGGRQCCDSNLGEPHHIGCTLPEEDR